MFIGVKEFDVDIAGSTFATKGRLKLAKEGVTLKIEDEIIELVTTESDSPRNVFVDGSKLEVKAVTIFTEGIAVGIEQLILTGAGHEYSYLDLNESTYEIDMNLIDMNFDFN